MTKPKLKVLYIAGSGRCGSTLLHNMLAQIDGFCGVGEIYQIWGRGFLRNMLCGCQRPFRECPTWTAVLDRACDGFDAVDVQAMHALSSSFTIERLHRLLVPSLRRRTLQCMQPYLEVVERLYEAVAETTGARVIVDSSKTPFYGFLLRHLESIEPYVVLLTRDPRAVCHSWTRQKRFQPEGHEPHWMSRHHPAKSALQWAVRNSLTERFVFPGPERSLRLRYEQLVEHPYESLRDLRDLVGETGPLDFVDGRSVEIRRESHSVFGNLVRFQSGTVELKRDELWRRDMRKDHQLVVSALTLPQLARYGYRAGNRAAPA